jgi:hypothetical protein
MADPPWLNERAVKMGCHLVGPIKKLQDWFWLIVIRTDFPFAGEIFLMGTTPNSQSSYPDI